MKQDDIDRLITQALRSRSEAEREAEIERILMDAEDSLNEENLILHSSFRGNAGYSSFRRIAAIFLAAAFLGTLAWAFIPNLITSKEVTTQPTEASTPLSLEEGTEVRLFSNARLDSILAVVAAHYGHTVCFRDSGLCAWRLSTSWNREDSLAVFIETLNEFDGLRLSDERDTLFIQSVTIEEEEDEE